MTGIEIVRGIYEAFGRGDLTAVLKPLSEDIEWIIEGPSEVVPFFKTFRGKSEVGRSFSIISETIDMESFELDKVVGDDTTIVAIGRFAWRAKPTQKRVDLHFAHVYTLKAEKVVALREFGDTWAAAQAFMPD